LYSVCTVFVPFRIGYFESPLTIRDLHNYKVVPYGFHMEAQPPSDVLGGCAFERRKELFNS
jgi:hypothetical protein